MLSFLKRLFHITSVLALTGLLSIQAPPVLQCGPSPSVTRLIDAADQQQWADFIAELSGEKPVMIDGASTTIETRYSEAMFSGRENARAFDYVTQRILEWYPADQVQEQPFAFDGHVWKNLILEIPGAVHPDQVILLTAHLDSTSEDSFDNAPGASDNATGVAALLEAARIFRGATFERTLRLVWFTGEEQGLVGSRAYAREADLDNILAVYNLDMFGYDSDDDRCLELHVGTLPASQPLGACFMDSVQAYAPALKVDYINAYDMNFSDHAAFWEKDVGALEVLENFSYNSPRNGCEGLRDNSPYYHTSRDTMDKLDLPFGFAIVRASLAAAASSALPEAIKEEQCSGGLKCRNTVSLKNLR
ncbi:MAG: M20/M25/M40 family metallo-hydrolase [Anaerolineae bacterium]|nr:M20/M25/M40 family metallo-hydrolase [Anaerolineae bacterium]